MVDVDETTRELICEVDHFSMYAAAVDPGVGPGGGGTEPTGGGGGGGGCFVGASGVPSVSGIFGWMMAMMLTIALMVLKGR